MFDSVKDFIQSKNCPRGKDSVPFGFILEKRSDTWYFDPEFLSVSSSQFCIVQICSKGWFEVIIRFYSPAKDILYLFAPRILFASAWTLIFSHGHFTLFWVKTSVKTNKILGSARDLICINPARLILYRFNFFIQLLEYSKPNPSSPPPPSSSSFYPWCPEYPPLGNKKSYWRSAGVEMTRFLRAYQILNSKCQNIWIFVFFIGFLAKTLPTGLLRFLRFFEFLPGKLLISYTKCSDFFLKIFQIFPDFFGFLN